LRGGYKTEILRKIWFDRANLKVSRLEGFGPKGVLLSDIHFANWQPTDTPAAANATQQEFPRSIRIERPHDDYRLDLQVAKISLNEEIPAERFKLEQPAGADLVRVGESNSDQQPKQDQP
jgi:hypothetical protein